MNKDIYRLNNFDLLRLLAALQVAVNHAIGNLSIEPGEFATMLLRISYLFPGVPIFFFISGFLISKSYESNHHLSDYFQNRVLRLYPGLITCVAISFVLIFLSGYMASTNTGFLDWALLFLAKTSFIQFYNPDFMRAYGDGVLNGSLWTITVELQFYLMVPVFYILFNLLDNRKANKKLLYLLAFFLIINRLYAYIPAEYHETIPYKLLGVSFLPWFYMFLLGVLAQKNFDTIHKYIKGKFHIFLVLYLVIGTISINNSIVLGNNINPLLYILLIITILSFAYSMPGLSNRILRRNDISYGTYIYHMPVLNFMTYSGMSGNVIYMVLALLTTVVVATLSWIFIEKPSLLLKKHPLNPLNK